MVLRSITFCLCIMSTTWTTAQEGLPPEGAHQGDAMKYRAVLDRYCVTCHNDTLKTAGLALDKADVLDIGKDAQLWERVVTKLSLRAMPPVGMPRPAGNVLYEDFLHYLEVELNKAAEASRNIGYKSAHRLNRSEYANAIRDLLNLEIDSTELLPADNVGDGFDNNAEVLVFSPLLMESYVAAAAKISRLAIGPFAMEPASETYTVPDTYAQQARASEDLPIASRGGTVIQHYFPQDGEYIINVKLHRNLEGYIRGLRREHTMDFRLNHVSMGMVTIGGEVHGRSGPIFTDKQTAEYAGQLEQVGYEFTADNKLNLEFQAKAGMGTIGVTFVDDSAKPTGILTPELTLAEKTQYKGGVPTVASLTITGPYNARGPGLTASQKRIFQCRPAPSASLSQQETCARKILSGLARLAYRRPVKDAEVDELVAMYREDYTNGKRFESGISLALQSILTSPDFLIRIEAEPAGLAQNEIYRINDLDLASRLSFFLWSSIPDEELLKLAEENKLHEAHVLKQQVQRMIQDPRFSAFINNFGGQWLTVRNLDNAEPNIYIFSGYDGELKESFKQELLLWFGSMVKEDQSILELMTSDYTFVNGRLAEHYGIPGVDANSPFIRVSLSGIEQRKGLLGKGGILLATSYNNRTSPVLRGKWVLQNLLSMPPPPPPEDVPALVTSDSGKVLTLKEAMEKHRANPVCSSCHKLMDPIGFALENFDAIGSYRTRYVEADADVDVSGTLFDGTEIDTVDDFNDGLLKYSDRVVHTVAEKVLTYALGRQLNVYDQYEIRRIAQKSASADYTWSSLLFAVIESVPFQHRRVYKP